jgi:hypothetical protein
MAFELHAYALTEDGEIHVQHIFYGRTKQEADRHFDAHVKACPMFGPADHDGRVISFFKEVDELPCQQSAEREAADAEEDDGDSDDDDEGPTR